MVHPPVAQLARDLVTPQLREGAKLSEVMLLIIAIVGTTIAPWQLFFQQSYVIDKRITPRFISYEKADLWLGIMLVIIGAVAMMAFTAAAFDGKPEYAETVELTIGAPARFSVKCNWKRRRSSLVAVSGDRPGNLVSFTTVRM